MQTAIKVENLSKKFRIGRLRPDAGTLRDLVGDVIKYPFSRNKDQESKNLWALRDINFEINQGETFGIIGGNGAGKSTLLKILSRIIKPTTGRARLIGRVGSLLEIGTGFHQDLTGRENIFLNGAVLGMRRREVEEKFDEIVAFANLEKFLETPVKFYSTGMYARLAFAVAAHLEPEILVIDEVLAVGDAAFQAKCLGKMEKVAENGRTVLFVSHDSHSITKLCRKGIYLEKGHIKESGDMKDVMTRYRADYETVIAAEEEIFEEKNAESRALENKEKGFIKWDVRGSKSKIPHSVISKETATLEFIFISTRLIDTVSFRFSVKDLFERIILSGTNVTEIKAGTHRIQWTCDLPFKVDSYRIFVEAYSLTEEFVLDLWECEPKLGVLSDNSLLPGQIEGLINIPTTFSVDHE